ncbi:two-component system response regulator [Candidatus Epulonipiscium fishelsonii]|uniref:Two-component system response regulator n=1 Tax=Candidatus Epulonipiscium fishelsonii TaxID=77094 RepID=A0ACC8XGL4_9FIRM|nr:two-component system response regulator [Epulopiscium sp. SCG-B05WGA-EpuloA1]ONI42780.1 two-component system response regulator [Epulopiscium sp. SCG-B11WGA-EpuloA1]
MKKQYSNPEDIVFLTVDDTQFMREFIKRILKENGFEKVYEAENGLEAIKQSGKLKPDVIFLDITMPKLRGIDAIQKILEVSPKSKIIMCSAMSQQNVVVEAIKKGARDFVTKPIDPDRLLIAINKVL